MFGKSHGESGDVANKALVIDDDPFTLDLFLYELSSQGFEVTTANS